MSHFASARVAAAILSYLVSCGTDAGREPRPLAREPEPSGVSTMTLRFVNRSSADLYVDLTYGPPISIVGDKGELPRAAFCTADCDSCQCNDCGSPARSARRIRAGEAFDVEWTGDYYEPDSCGACACERKRYVKPGAYEVTMSAGTRVVPSDAAAPSPSDPNLLTAQVGGATCTARGKVVTTAQPSTFELAFVCTTLR